MQKSGYRNSTVQSRISALKSVARRTNLLDPESVKVYLAEANVTEGRKSKLVEDLSNFYAYKHISFEKPHYRRIETLPFIPLESEIDQLISGLGKKLSTFLQLLKETGMRPGEAWNLKQSDIDREQHVANVTPEKHSRPRRLPISNRFLAMLSNLPCAGSYLFRNPAIDPLNSLEDFTRNFELQRTNLAKKLQNPRIKKIGFRTLRHWKATTLYHKTKDILLVQRTLGHKNIQNTLVYTHLIDFQDDEYVCKSARTVEEATALLEQGFDFVLEIDQFKLFRKRK